MSEMSPFPEPERPQDETPQPQAAPERDDRGDEWDRDRRSHRYDRSGAWVGAAVLIALGVIFLLRNAGVSLPVLDNWWALFILIPAVTSFSRAARIYQRNGHRVDRGVRSALFGGFVLTLVSLAFLLSAQWRIIWPIFLILAGLSALITAIMAR